MKFRLAAAFGMALVSFCVLARDSGTVKGTVTFNGKPKNLACVYAWKAPSLFTKGQINTVVVLTDTKLDDKTLADRMAMIDAAKQGKFTGVQVNFDPKGDVEGGTFYSSAVDGYFDAAGMHKWQRKTLTPTMIEGTLSTDGTRRFFDTSYAYSATFKAPIGAAPK